MHTAGRLYLPLILRAVLFCPEAVCLCSSPFAAPPIMIPSLTLLCTPAQAIRCTAQLRHSGQCMALIALNLEEARSVNTPLLPAGLLH